MLPPGRKTVYDWFNRPVFEPIVENVETDLYSQFASKAVRKREAESALR